MCRREVNCAHLGIPGERFYEKVGGVYYPNETVRITVITLEVTGMTAKDSLPRALDTLKYDTKSRRFITAMSIAHPNEERTNYNNLN